MDKETRVTQHDVELRMDEGDDGKGAVLVGYGAVFNQRSENLGGFTEVIQAGAFDDVLGDDVRALFNHDSNIILGRNGTTMTLSVDPVGLRYEIDLPDTQMVRDMVLSPVQRGDVNQSSFGFSVDVDKWDEDDEGRVTRTIVKVKRLYDVSPVTFPAYPDTTVASRSLESFKDAEPPAMTLDEAVTRVAEQDNEITLLKGQNARFQIVIDDLKRVNKALSR
jgi:uncharacterized protein